MSQRPPAQRESRFPWTSLLMIAFAVLGSATALFEDYRSARRGEPAFVFRPPAPRAAAKAKPAPAKAPEADRKSVV